MTLSPLFADLSNNDPHLDARVYRDSGMVIVALKASEGTGFIDPDHERLALAAGMVHVAVMHYHFARPDDGTSGEEEADHFLTATDGLRGPHDYVVYDGERA